MTKETPWLKPEQIESLREACHSNVFRTFHRRNEAIIAVMYDTGLRPMETLNLTVEMWDRDAGAFELPGSAQKDYPNDNSPPPARIKLCQDRFTQDTNVVLKEYMLDRTKDSQFLFPSKNNEFMKTRSLRRLIKKLAVEADVTPYKGFVKSDSPDSISPHAIRHSVAYRMMAARDDPTGIDAVKRRLRHRSRTTTERYYSHFDEV